MIRLYHSIDKHECVNAGLHNAYNKGIEKGKVLYAEFLSNAEMFKQYAMEMIRLWYHSAEQYLTNESMNRIAYIGQATMLYAEEVPRNCKGGFYLLPESDQKKANQVAEQVLKEALGMIKARIQEYVENWKSKGYHYGIPDELPDRCISPDYGPSYMAIAHAILSNDHQLKSLGFTERRKDDAYRALKRIELQQRGYERNGQQYLPM